MSQIGEAGSGQFLKDAPLFNNFPLGPDKGQNIISDIH